MSFYSRRIFPKVVDWTMSTEVLTQHRRELVAQARGEVLEIGLGTGLNLPYYRRDLVALTGIDPNPGMARLSGERLRKLPFPARLQTCSAESLALPDCCFDSVVVTWTLCSIPDPAPALSEMFRVLRPGGRLLFIEHGLSDNPDIQRWQHRINPWWGYVADGCNLDRNAELLVSKAGFRIQQCSRFDMERTPRIFGHTYSGVALK